MKVVLPQVVPNDKKEMISYEFKDGKHHISINYSSVSLINTCMRKTHYLLQRDLRTSGDSPALVIGKSIHKGLEHWYTFPKSMRKELTRAQKERAEVLAHAASDSLLQDEQDTLELEAVRQFLLSMKPLWGMQGDKRSPDNGVKILLDYFKTYKNDPYKIHIDERGPVVERNLRTLLHEDPETVVTYHGTVDAIFVNEETDELFCVDHKTTSSLGADFMNRIKPNHQYTGYVWLSRECLKLPAKTFIVNGIQVAKTKTSFLRQMTDRTEEDFHEMKLSTLFAVANYLDALETNFFPQNSPDSCGLWGGCQYLEICGAPTKLRENIINYQYPDARKQS